MNERTATRRDEQDSEEEQITWAREESGTGQRKPRARSPRSCDSRRGWLPVIKILYYFCHGLIFSLVAMLLSHFSHV